MPNYRALGVGASAWQLSRPRGGLLHPTRWDFVRRLTWGLPLTDCPSGALASGGLENSQQREEAYNACSDRFKGKNAILVCFAPKANLMNSLLRESVSRNWPLVCLELLDRCPEAEDRTSCSGDPRRGGEPLSSATFTGWRNWEKRSLETAAP